MGQEDREFSLIPKSVTSKEVLNRVWACSVSGHNHNNTINENQHLKD